MKFLQPLAKVPQQREQLLEDAILRVIFDLIYKPLQDELKVAVDVIVNDASVLDAALRKGTVRYYQGTFRGKFNSKLGKEMRKMGAKFNHAQKTYVIDIELVSPNILSIASQMKIKDQMRYVRSLHVIDNLNIKTPIHDFSSQYDNFVNYVDSEFNRTVKPSLALEGNITLAMRESIAINYSNNLNLHIKDFADEQVPILRELVEKNMFDGNRSSELIDIIRDRFGVTQSKAKFLARQETNLITAQYRQLRYKDAGINKYKWSTSKDSRVRKDHKELDQTIQSYDQPPIVDAKTGRRAHAGEDYLCRCVQIPILGL